MSNNRKKFFQFKDIDGYKPEGDPAALAKPITELGLHIDTVSKLQAANINNLSELASIEMKHAYRIDRMNRKDVFAVLKVLHMNKLDFKRSLNQNTDESEESGDSENRKQRANEINKPRENKREVNKNIANSGIADERSIQAASQTNANADKQNNTNRLNFRERQGNAPMGRQNNIKDSRQPVAPQNTEGQTRHPNKFKDNDRIKVQGGAPAPQREKINTHDFLRNKLNDNGRDRSNPRDFDKNKNDKKPPAKRVIELPPIVIEDGLYKFFKLGKWGYKDAVGKVVIEPQFDEAYNFSEGRAAVELNERLGFINKLGEVTVDYQFDTVCSYSEGLASVTKNDKCAYINKDGEYDYEFEFEAATSFVDGVALVKKDGKWGYLNRETREIRLR